MQPVGHTIMKALVSGSIQREEGGSRSEGANTRLWRSLSQPRPRSAARERKGGKKKASPRRTCENFVGGGEHSVFACYQGGEKGKTPSAARRLRRRPARGESLIVAVGQEQRVEEKRGRRGRGDRDAPHQLSIHDELDVRYRRSAEKGRRSPHCSLPPRRLYSFLAGRHSGRKKGEKGTARQAIIFLHVLSFVVYLSFRALGKENWERWVCRGKRGRFAFSLSSSPRMRKKKRIPRVPSSPPPSSSSQRKKKEEEEGDRGGRLYRLLILLLPAASRQRKRKEKELFLILSPLPLVEGKKNGITP